MSKQSFTTIPSDTPLELRRTLERMVEEIERLTDTVQQQEQRIADLESS